MYKWFKTKGAATRYRNKEVKKGNRVNISWNSARGGYDTYTFGENPGKKSKSSLLKKLRRGIRGIVKISRGKLIIKT